LDGTTGYNGLFCVMSCVITRRRSLVG